MYRDDGIQCLSHLSCYYLHNMSFCTHTAFLSMILLALPLTFSTLFLLCVRKIFPGSCCNIFHVDLGKHSWFCLTSLTALGSLTVCIYYTCNFDSPSDALRKDVLSWTLTMTGSMEQEILELLNIKYISVECSDLWTFSLTNNLCTNVRKNA